MTDDRSIDDLLGEALRRHRHGDMRPLWADMPEGEIKRAWRRLGAHSLTVGAERDAAIDERDRAQGLLREAAARTLSVRTALTVIRDRWRASAEYAAAYATDDPQTPEQWRAFGGVENLRACADELDPEKASIFEPSELAKARAEIERLTRQNAALAEALRFYANAEVYRPDAIGRVGDLTFCARALLAQLDAPHRVRHKKRGTTYSVIGDDFRLQSARPIEEGETIVVYRGDDGKGWARPLDEFTDGRFEPVEPRS
jgi:hypothetical protein